MAHFRRGRKFDLVAAVKFNLFIFFLVKIDVVVGHVEEKAGSPTEVGLRR